MRSNGLALIGIAAAAALALGGCSQTREALGLNKSAPDEFRVVSRAPLSLPPDFTLRPPQPGAARPQEGTPRDQAASAVFGGTAGTAQQQATLFGNLAPSGELGEDFSGGAGAGGPAGLSTGERALLANAGATDVDPSIRQIVDQETAALVEQDNSLVERLIFWREGEPFGTVVDPVQEQQRLRENAALGKPVTEGETPTIARRKRALLEGLF